MELSAEPVDSPQIFPRKLLIISELQVQYDDDLKHQLRLAAIFNVKTFTLIYESKDNVHLPRDPYKLKAQLTQQIPHHDQIIKVINTRQGKLLIQTSGIEAALELSEVNEILGSAVKVKTPLENISSRFLLRDIPAELDLNSLVEEIEAHGIAVNNAQRFTKKGSREPSESVLITSYGNQIPKETAIFWTVYKLEKFVDFPRQCQKCFKFNHSTKKCKLTDALCPKCGNTHQDACTTESLSCINCKAPHLATDNGCPTRKTESKLLKFKSDNCLTFTEARRLFPKKDKNSYAAVTAQGTTQTADLNSFQNILTNSIKDLAQSLTTSFNANLEALSKSFDAKLEALNKIFDSKLETFMKVVDNRISQVLNITTQIIESTKSSSSGKSPKRKSNKQSEYLPDHIRKPPDAGGGKTPDTKVT